MAVKGQHRHFEGDTGQSVAINFAENFTSSSIPGGDLGIWFIDSFIFLRTIQSPICCQPCQGFFAHCPPPYFCNQFPILLALLWNVSQIHHPFGFYCQPFFLWTTGPLFLYRLLSCNLTNHTTFLPLTYFFWNHTSYHNPLPPKNY